MYCNKCKGLGTILLRKRDSYCDKCFTTNTNHKFRACIGKNKTLSKNDNVLVCISGGVGSTVLLDLVHNGITMNSHKKLRIIPHFLHLIDADNNVAEAANVLEQCKKYNINIYLSHISEYMKTNIKLPETNCMPAMSSENATQLHAILKSMSITATNDFLQKIKRHMFITFAKLLDCNFVFTAETTTTLAINLLSNLALGRGSQIQNDVGFIDTRDDVKILRPMKDISKEELDYYLNIKNLVPECRKSVKENSLQSTIASFVSGLQENFQATISTVCKTADKIGVFDGNASSGNCIICENNLDAVNSKLTALKATNFSRTVSESLQSIDPSCSSTALQFETLDETKVMFPYIHKQLCYGCSRNFLEMEKCNLLKLIQKLQS